MRHVITFMQVKKVERPTSAGWTVRTSSGGTEIKFGISPRSLASPVIVAGHALLLTSRVSMSTTAQLPETPQLPPVSTNRKR